MTMRSGPEGTGTGGGDRLGEATQDLAERAVDLAQQRVGTEVDSQLGRAADVLHQVAEAVRKSGDEIRGDQPQVASLTETAARQVDRASDFLRGTDVEGVVHEVETFARRQPVLFLGGAVALGALAARFLKASPETRYGYSGQYARYGSGSYAGRMAGRSGYGYAPGTGTGYGYGGYEPRTGYGTARTDRSYERTGARQGGYDSGDATSGGYEDYGRTDAYATGTPRTTGTSGPAGRERGVSDGG